jgi:Zn-dependent protease with chaperone function
MKTMIQKWLDESNQKDLVLKQYNATLVSSVLKTRFNAVALPNGEIVITRGLFDNLSSHQLKAVMEHEACHVKHRDGVAQLILSGILLIASITVTRRAPKGMKIKAYIASSVVTQIILSGFSWFTEFRADRAAFNDVALIQALHRIDDLNGTSPLGCITHPPTSIRAKMLIKKYR